MEDIINRVKDQQSPDAGSENKDNNMAERYKDIPGWGIDADPENEPNYPIKRWNGADHQRLNYQRPQQQKQNVEVLHSNERPNLSAVYGTSSPPSGFSGDLRRFAFRYSEGDARHWFTLVLADRINVMEGIADDLKHGIVPNFFVERGWKAEWKYNCKGMIKKIALTAVITVAVISLLRRKKKLA
jgi:hypothetical protein